MLPIIIDLYFIKIEVSFTINTCLPKMGLNTQELEQHSIRLFRNPSCSNSYKTIITRGCKHIFISGRASKYLVIVQTPDQRTRFEYPYGADKSIKASHTRCDWSPQIFLRRGYMPFFRCLAHESDFVDDFEDEQAPLWITEEFRLIAVQLQNIDSQLSGDIQTIMLSCQDSITARIN